MCLILKEWVKEKNGAKVKLILYFLKIFLVTNKEKHGKAITYDHLTSGHLYFDSEKDLVKA